MSQQAVSADIIPNCVGAPCKGCPSTAHTDKKENKTFPIFKEIQTGAKSYMRKGFLIYEEMGKYFPMYEEAISHI
jgi:hypothetical protein